MSLETKFHCPIFSFSKPVMPLANLYSCGSCNLEVAGLNTSFVLEVLTPKHVFVPMENKIKGMWNGFCSDQADFLSGSHDCLLVELT